MALHPETLAIVEATLPSMTSQHASLTLRMWHHLLPHPERDALFADFSGNGGSLVQTFLAAATARVQGQWPSLRQAPGLRREHLPMLEHAFAEAVQDVLGRVGVPMVMRAWRTMLADYLDRICSETPNQPA